MPGEEHLQYTPEPAAVSAAFVGWSALAGLLLLGIAIGGLYGTYRHAVPTPTSPSPATFPQPRVDTQQTEELHRILAAQTQRLETWAWADSQHTRVQIPIERAMQLLASKGEGAYQPLLPPQQALSSPTAAAERATIESGNAQNGGTQPDHLPPPEGPK